jgi:hypothetical protein
MNPAPPPPAAPDEGGSYWAGPKTLAAALVLACIAGLGVWLTHNHDSGTTAAGGTAYDSACGLKGGTAGTPTAAPATQLHEVGQTWFPVSTAYGPGHPSETGPSTCFARTPTGAVFAAWTIPSLTGVPAVVKQQTVPGPGQTTLLKEGPKSPPANAEATPVGFRLTSYNPDAATVSFHIRSATGDVACISNVQWSGGATGDWRLAVQPDGSVLSDCGAQTEFGPDWIAWGPTS